VQGGIASGVTGESARGAKAGHGDRDKPADRSLGRQTAGCGQGVEAVAGKLTRRHVILQAAGLRALGQQAADEAMQLLLGPGDMLASVSR